VRTLVTWHYQWIVWNDFLPHVVQRSVLEEVAKAGVLLFPRRYSPLDDDFSLPAEFTQAAFRFGHSMVQESYRTNASGFRAIETLLKMTKQGGGIVSSLPAEFVIDWKFFFGRDANALLNRGEEIDTFVTEALCELDGKVVEGFLAMRNKGGAKVSLPAGAKVSLPLMALMRGANVGLVSGEDLARWSGHSPISTAQMAALPRHEVFFSQPAMRNRTPLFYYLLREAKVNEKLEPGTANDPEPIQKLGALGSRIVAETFLQVLLADRDSISNDGRRWRPPLLELASGQLFRLSTMPDVVKFAELVSARAA
jgi:Animal haem peroxidase